MNALFLHADPVIKELSDQLLSNAPHMKRLLLEGDIHAFLHWPGPMHDDVGPKRGAPTLQFDSLQDLVIRSGPLDQRFYVEWSSIINFSALRRLVLWRCHPPVHKFLAVLWSQLQGQVIQLQHFAVDIGCNNGYPLFSLYKLHRSVAQALRGCTKLRSLHLNWAHLWATENMSETEDFGKPLELPSLDICKSLEILSLHDDWSRDDNIVSWFQMCPRLTQLALDIPECLRHPRERAWQYTRIFVSSYYMHSIRLCMIRELTSAKQEHLRLLPKLRTVHFGKSWLSLSDRKLGHFADQSLNISKSNSSVPA